MDVIFLAIFMYAIATILVVLRDYNTISQLMWAIWGWNAFMIVIMVEGEYSFLSVIFIFALMLYIAMLWSELILDG